MALVKYNGKNVYHCADLRLLPGVNKINDALLEEVKSYKLFQWRIDNKIIEILKEKKAKDPSIKQLVDLMPEVYDVKLLKQYISEDKDKRLVRAAKKQLKKIEAVEVEEDKDGVTVK